MGKKPAMSDRPKLPAFPRFSFPPPAYGSPAWEEKMRVIVAYINDSCAFYRAQRKPPKPRPWQLIPPFD